MFCSNCGVTLSSAAARFCEGCGAPRGGEPATATVGPDPQPQPAALVGRSPAAEVPLWEESVLELPLDLDAARSVFQSAFSRFNNGQVAWDAATNTLSGRMYWSIASYPASLRLHRTEAGTVADLAVPKAKPMELASIRARFADVLRHLDEPDFKPNKTGMGPWANGYAASPARRVKTLAGAFVVFLAVAVGGTLLLGGGDSGSSKSSTGDVDTSSTSYQDGYNGGQTCAQTACGGGGAEAACSRVAQGAALNPLPGEDLVVAGRGCIDGYRAAGGP